MALDKSKLATMMKLQAQKPTAGQLMLKKKALLEQPLPDEPEPTEVQPTPEASAAPMDEYEQALAMPGMVEEAAQEAEAAADEELEGMIPSIYTEDGSAPVWADPDLWAKAQEAVGIGTPDEERYEEPMAVVAYLYRKLGGSLDGVAPQTGESEMGEMDEEDEEGEGTGENEMGEEGEASEVTGGAVRNMAGRLLAAKTQAAGNPAAAPASFDEAATSAGSGNEEQSPEDINALVEEAADEALSSMDPEVAEYLAGYDAERDGNPPEWVADEATWEKAVAAVKPKWDDYEEPYAVVAHVYKKMGGTFASQEN